MSLDFNYFSFSGEILVFVNISPFTFIERLHYQLVINISQASESKKNRYHYGRFVDALVCFKSVVPG